MGFNKTKALEAAQKFLNNGKLPQAIAQYQDILRNEPNDQVTLMTIGDLLVRNNHIEDATDYFERLAKIYLNNGFVSKAIAIYKKISKLMPDQTRPLERLAELYVQQGVLSEARPIYLQLAEGYVKQKDSDRAVGVLRKLLEAEPDNTRVQHRLAEIYSAMGQPKEAAAVYQVSARRLAERGDWQEALEMSERVLKSDEKSSVARTIQARALASLGKSSEAVAVLEALPVQKEISEATELLLDLYLAAGEFGRATDLSRKVFEANLKNYSFLFKTATAMLEAGEGAKTLELLDQVRVIMIESADSDRLAQALSTAAERMPTKLEPLEWLVELYGRTNDSFRLPDALTKLGNAAFQAGRLEQALESFEQALERTPDDESLQTRVAQVRARLGMEPGAMPAPPVAPEDTAAAPESQPAAPESDLDEDTRHYVTQALTDVDLFSSYGLTQKAIELLEQVVVRVPRHTQALEKLLDLYLGAGNDRHTAELAATLEEVYSGAGDTTNAERFAELRRRYQRAADRTPAEPAPPPPPAPPAEFVVPTAQDSAVASTATEPAEELTGPPDFLPLDTAGEASVEEAVIETTPTQESNEEEMDLTAEWAALSEQFSEPDAAVKEIDVPDALPVTESAENTAATEVQSNPTEPAHQESPAADEGIVEETPVEASAAGEEGPVDFDFVLEPVGAPASADSSRPAPMSADEFMTDLVAELESLALPGQHEETPANAPAAGPPHAEPVAVDEAPSAPHQEPAPVPANGTNAQLSEVFEEFRAELGEMNEDTEDLETHYNLGIAYREMGLLEEAIGEFQKVAKAVQSGRPFRYSMQCCTLLGLIFMDKAQPSIAALWYDRALETTGLDQESILALRYDLGVAQESAGDLHAARENFRRVYALNIDYRDVAERIAAIEKRV